MRRLFLAAVLVGCGGFTQSNDAGAADAARDDGIDASDMDVSLVDPADVVEAEPGYDVNVCNGSTLAITNVTPDLACVKNTLYTIKGSGFVATPKVEFYQGGPPLPLANVQLVDANTITAVLPSASIGAIDLIVTNPDGCATYRKWATHVWCPD